VRHVLNLFNFDGGRKCLIGEAWIPSNRVDDLANALRRGNDRSGSSVPSIMQMTDVSEHDRSDIPVRMITNKFTKTYNNIVEAYGIASYGEGMWIFFSFFPLLLRVIFFFLFFFYFLFIICSESGSLDNCDISLFVCGHVRRRGPRNDDAAAGAASHLFRAHNTQKKK
jgi:hypothetical protein